MVCPECNLPDPYGGEGDGIGSCDCPRCPACGEPDPAGFHNDGTTCDGDDLGIPDWPDGDA